MWREVWQRLGFGYILLLPALLFLGAAVQSTMEVLLFELDEFLLHLAGRGTSDQGFPIDAMRWLIFNPPSIMILFLFPWWLGAWRMLRSAEVMAPHDFWKVVFAISNAILLFLGFFVWGTSVLVRKLYLMSYVGGPSPLLHVITFFLGSLVALTYAAAFKFRRKPQKSK